MRTRSGLAAVGVLAVVVGGFAAVVVLAAVLRDNRLAVAAALAAVALALALRDLFAGVGAAVTRPCAVGDRVRAGDVEGTVVRTGLTRTAVLEDTGAVVSFANQALLATAVRTYPDVVRTELRVGVPYRADWEHAERILRDVGGDGSDVSVVLTDNWIELVLRLTEPARDEASRAILRRFTDAGIPIASRTVEVKVGDPLDAARPSNLP